MAEVVMGPGDDRTEVVQALLELADDPADVVWSPRPDAGEHGGVYVVPDELGDKYASQRTTRARRVGPKDADARVKTADVEAAAKGQGK